VLFSDTRSVVGRRLVGMDVRAYLLSTACCCLNHRKPKGGDLRHAGSVLGLFF
jgi:hypothetical protein